MVWHIRRDDVELNSKSHDSVESLGVEVVHTELPRLVQPNEVVVSSTSTVCMEEPDPVQSPYGQLFSCCGGFSGVDYVSLP